MIAMIGRILPRLTIVVLAAGYSTRLGQPKALARIHGSSLLARTLTTLRPFAKGSRIAVVVPPHALRYRIECGCAAALFIRNPQRAAGLSSSVRCAVRRMRFSAGILLLPVDLVRLDSRDIARLISRWSGRRRVVVARRLGVAASTPLILPRALYPRALSITGDKGLRELVRELPAGMVSLVNMPSAGADVDTPAELAQARQRRTRIKS